MLTNKWALGLICGLCGVSVATVSGCSAKSGAHPASEADAGNAGSQPNARAKVANNDEDAGTADAGATGTRAAGGGASDAGPVEQDAGPRCDSSVLDEPDDDYTDTNCDGIDGDKNKAIFVANAGNDAAEGTLVHPVATLQQGIALAIAQHKDVYVCKGDYAASTLLLSSKGVRVYGGYDCTDHWARSALSSAHLKSTSNTALSIRSVTEPVVFDHIDITAAKATSASDSSTVVLIANSNNVTLRRGTYAADAGADAVQPVAKPEATNSIPNCAAYVYPDGCYGEHGTDAYQFKNCFYDTTQGTTFYGSAPFFDTSVFQLAMQSDFTQVNQCKNTSSYGGRGGGTNTSQPLQGSSGTAGSPATTTGTLNGGDGTAGAAVAGASAGFGALNGDGYAPSNRGQAGEAGQVGQAGTGGDGGGFVTVLNGGTSDFQYALYAPRAGGGKGGWGGCGGDGGDAGNAGGASIAVAIYQSQVVLERLTLTTASGGKGSPGGLGGAGTTGQPGGSSGTAYYQCTKCVDSQASVCNLVNQTNQGSASWGGKGGKGGNGSQGGPGAGGPSIPLVVSGQIPSLSAVTFVSGSGGTGGSNGSARAADGESGDQKVLP